MSSGHVSMGGVWWWWSQGTRLSMGCGRGPNACALASPPPRPGPRLILLLYTHIHSPYAKLRAPSAALLACWGAGEDVPTFVKPAAPCWSRLARLPSLRTHPLHTPSLCSFSQKAQALRPQENDDNLTHIIITSHTKHSRYSYT